MSQTLLDGFWYDRPATVEACFEEISTIDRVINHRIQGHARALQTGHALRARPMVDDLLARRRRFSDLAECLMIEQSWETKERFQLQILIAKIKKNPKHPRWVG